MPVPAARVWVRKGAAAGTTTVPGSWTGDDLAARNQGQRLQLLPTILLMAPELMALRSWGLSVNPAWWSAS